MVNKIMLWFILIFIEPSRSLHYIFQHSPLLVMKTGMLQVTADEEHRVLGRHDDQAAWDCEEQPPDRTGPAGCPPLKLSSSVSSTEDLAGDQAGRQHPLHHLPESDIVAKRDDAKNGTKPGADAMVRRLNTPSG